MAEISSTTKPEFAPAKAEKMYECALPYTYIQKNGEIIESDILTLIKDGKKFKINLYPTSIKPACRGHPDGLHLPQKTKFIITRTWLDHSIFYYPSRLYNKQTGQFDTNGACRTRWFIDLLDWSLHQADFGDYYKWTKEEYRIILEPYERAWNQAVLDIDRDGPVYVNDSLTPFN